MVGKFCILDLYDEGIYAFKVNKKIVKDKFFFAGLNTFNAGLIKDTLEAHYIFKKALDFLGDKNQNIYVFFDSDGLLYKRIDSPFLKNKDLQSYIYYKLQDLFYDSADDLSYSFGKMTDKSLGIFAVKKEITEAFSKFFSKYDLKIKLVPRAAGLLCKNMVIRQIGLSQGFFYKYDDDLTYKKTWQYFGYKKIAAEKKLGYFAIREKLREDDLSLIEDLQAHFISERQEQRFLLKGLGFEGEILDLPYAGENREVYDKYLRKNFMDFTFERRYKKSKKLTYLSLLVIAIIILNVFLYLGLDFKLKRAESDYKKLELKLEEIKGD
ncbi:hypothetical protein HMPREF3189_01337 [Clostridiales bacterium KA00134]|nr:hypothetical protein HMPREF3189_01337 [Clostridiales bacterium KA00134]